MWGRKGRGDGAFAQYAAGVAVDASRHVYVADYDNHRIQVFDSGGDFRGKWGKQGFGKGEFLGPRFVARDAEGFVYVTDGRQRIQVFKVEW